MQKRRAGLILWLTVMCLAGSALAQDNEAAKANDLFQAGKRIDALAFYEDLAKANPDEMVYQQRLADCLGAAAVQTTDPAQVKALRIRERDAARRAVALGNKANYIQDMANLDPDAPVMIAPTSPGGELLQEAEKAFTAGDFQMAMTKYVAAAEADPKLYEAPLYAGDTAFTQHDLAAAAQWFARAIEIDPNRETAYRYWGDAILRYGNDPDSAKEKYIDAIVAEPYNKFAWQGLQQWSVREKAVMMPPEIDRPTAPEVDQKNPNNTNITIDVGSLNDKKNPGGFAWMMYSLVRAGYRGDVFKKDFPNEKTYRHTLKEEDAALSSVASTLEEKKIKRNKLDESDRNLLDVYDAGMLNCWILINAADEGIMQDYAAYRDQHRKLLHDYIERFVIHGGVNPQQQ